MALTDALHFRKVAERMRKDRPSRTSLFFSKSTVLRAFRDNTGTRGAVLFEKLSKPRGAGLFAEKKEIWKCKWERAKVKSKLFVV